ncbi:SpoIIE family protein phosphatase [Actinomadura nitritigenes]|uniref:SpoIIE family protein phosphatase n=2 Tax=Actinomadura nitritigenes TaxID=134602 RepID=A0ABS3RFH6_9ACTN|nr:SpoIIE family protein phosphatase [Actinomadura nitritigenes]
MRALLDAVLAISRELDLPVVLRRIVSTAMELVGARYGAMGVLNEDHTGLVEFIPLGLTDEEVADLAGVEFPHGRGVLGHLISKPDPLRVEDLPHHPESVGFPEGHPPMKTLLGVAISVRGTIYGNLYLSDRRDGCPFDEHDQAIVVALAGAAGVAIENARLYEQVRSGAEQFQRLLLPRLPDLAPFTAAAQYRPAIAGHHLGGDWYDALRLPDGACAAMIGDVVGHDLQAAAAMAQTRNMLRALLWDRRTPPSAVLTALDHTLHAITDASVTTACLARIEPENGGWTLRWSSAGHLPPLVLSRGGGARYLHAEPGVPLGVDTRHPRPDHTHPLTPGDTVILYTDGLVEHRDHPITTGLDALAHLAAAHTAAPLEELCRTLVDHEPSDGHDDVAILALRTPTGP